MNGRVRLATEHEALACSPGPQAVVGQELDEHGEDRHGSLTRVALGLVDLTLLVVPRADDSDRPLREVNV